MMLDFVEPTYHCFFSEPAELVVSEGEQAIPSSASDEIVFEIVTDLLESGLLGLLFSTKHFQTYCRLKRNKVSPTISNFIKALSFNTVLASEFQQCALLKFGGLNIDACRFESEFELSDHLQKRLFDVFKLDAVTWPDIDNPLEIQNAWKYRRACKGFKA